MIKTYTYLSYVSMSGIFGTLLGGLLLIIYCTEHLSSGDYSHDEIKLFDVTKMFGYIGITIFVFEGNGVVINLRAESKDKQKYRFMLYLAILTVITWYMLLGTITYITYRSQVMEYISWNLVPINAFTLIINILFCYNALTSYPV